MPPSFIYRFQAFLINILNISYFCKFPADFAQNKLISSHFFCIIILMKNVIL